MQMTTKDFRHSHLLRAISDCGTIEKLSKLTELSPQYLSQLKSRTRGIGDKTARKIEKGMKWPEGVMDRPIAGDDLDKELAYLLNTMPEDQAIQAMVDAVPGLSRDGVNILTTALLTRLNEPSDT